MFSVSQGGNGVVVVVSGGGGVAIGVGVVSGRGATGSTNEEDIGSEQEGRRVMGMERSEARLAGERHVGSRKEEEQSGEQGNKEKDGEDGKV